MNLFMITGLVLIIIILSVVIFRSQKNKKDFKKQKARFKEAYNAIEEERKSLALNLHDSLGQKLSATKLYFSGLEEIIEQQNDQNKMFYKKAVNLLDESFTELRDISYNVMPGSLIKYGLKPAVNEIINKISNLSKKITHIYL